DWLEWSKQNAGQDPNKFWTSMEEKLGKPVLQQIALVQAQQEGKLDSPAESTHRLTDISEGHLPERKGTTPEDEYARRMDAYLRGALDDPAFVRQTAGRH